MQRFARVGGCLQTAGGIRLRNAAGEKNKKIKPSGPYSSYRSRTVYFREQIFLLSTVFVTGLKAQVTRRRRLSSLWAFFFFFFFGTNLATDTTSVNSLYVARDDCTSCRKSGKEEYSLPQIKR